MVNRRESGKGKTACGAMKVLPLHRKGWGIVSLGAGLPGTARTKTKGHPVVFGFQQEVYMDLTGKVCMVRTYSAGVFLGEVVSRDGKEVHLKNARRMWYWDGAASLSQLATDGTSKPGNCKFPAAVDDVLLTEAIELIPATEAAIASIAAVTVWKK